MDPISVGITAGMFIIGCVTLIDIVTIIVDGWVKVSQSNSVHAFKDALNVVVERMEETDSAN